MSRRSVRTPSSSSSSSSSRQPSPSSAMRSLFVTTTTTKTSSAFFFVVVVVMLLLSRSGGADAFVLPSPSSTVPTTTTTKAIRTAVTAGRSPSHNLRAAAAAASDGSASASSSVGGGGLKPGDPVLLVGPGFLQLVLAKHLSHAGLRPIVVAQQSKLDSFFDNFLKTDSQYDIDGRNAQIATDSTIGMPEVGDPYFGELRGVVFCAEEAVLPPDFVTRVLDFTDQGKSAFAGNNNGVAGPARVVCALPVSNKVQKEKANSWIPIFNNDKTMEESWKRFYDAFVTHPLYSNADGGTASIVRFGSLLGGSFDGPDVLRDLGLDEGMYKMSLEQYRDMRERAFDRYKLGAQVLQGDAINPKPANQDALEKEALKGYPNEVREAFPILGGYPEMDRANRHTVAAGIVQALLMSPVDGGGDGDCCPKEFTILSKALSELPTPEAWREMFANPQPASWPDPYQWKPEEYGLQVDSGKKDKASGGLRK